MKENKFFFVVFALFGLASFSFGFFAAKTHYRDTTINIKIDYGIEKDYHIMCDLGYATDELEKIAKEYDCPSAKKIIRQFRQMNSPTDLRYLLRREAETLRDCDFPEKEMVITRLKSV